MKTIKSFIYYVVLSANVSFLALSSLEQCVEFVLPALTLLNTMETSNFFYNYSSFTITLLLFLLIIVANDLSFRYGRFVQKRTDEEIKSLTGSVQASVLGLLALLLGFTFSMSMQRFDQRSYALIEEANAIGTAVLRIKLLPVEQQQKTFPIMEKYINLRIELSQTDLTEIARRQAYNEDVQALQNQLWDIAVFSAEIDPRAVTSGAFINALNAMIDSQSKRRAILQMQVPEIVLLLLFVIFMASGSMLGYSSGLTGKRITTPTILVSFLISLIVFIIIDLDRPKRGFIQVNQSALIELRDQMNLP